MGPKAKAALPALEKAFKDSAEDLDVRVAAARAITSIKGIQTESLYKFRRISGFPRNIGLVSYFVTRYTAQTSILAAREARSVFMQMKR